MLLDETTFDRENFILLYYLITTTTHRSTDQRLPSTQASLHLLLCFLFWGEI